MGNGATHSHRAAVDFRVFGGVLLSEIPFRIGKLFRVVSDWVVVVVPFCFDLVFLNCLHKPILLSHTRSKAW